MKTSTLMADEPLAELTTSPTLPQVHLNAEGLAELYSFFLQYLQFKHGTDLEAAIDYIEEEVDILECKSAGNGETIAAFLKWHLRLHNVRCTTTFR